MTPRQPPPARPAGFQSLTWDGTDDSGAGVSSGVYYVRLRSAGEARSRKLVLLK